MSDEPYDDPDDDGWDEEEERLANAEMNCGRYAGASGCSLAGTEWCDWSCPFSDGLYQKMRRRGR